MHRAHFRGWSPSSLKNAWQNGHIFPGQRSMLQQPGKHRRERLFIIIPRGAGAPNTHIMHLHDTLARFLGVINEPHPAPT